MRFGNLWFVFLMFIISMSLYLGTDIYEDDVEENKTRDIYNYTEYMINWNESIFPMTTYNVSDKQIPSRLNNIIYKFADMIGYSIFEVSKMFIEIGYNTQGKYNFKFFITLTQILMWVMVIGILFYPVLILAVGVYELVKFVKNKIKKK